MAEGVTANFLEWYNSLISTLPSWAQNFLVLFALVLAIVIFCVFIWKFHKFISKKNILELNLGKYNISRHPFASKFFGVILYLLEYLIILPFLIFFWFSVFILLFLIFLTEDINLNQLLVVAAVLIASIRISSYIPRYGEKVAKEIAKLLPFNLLAFSLLTPNFFSIDRIVTHISQVPSLFDNILIYFLFIIALEMILRFFDFISTLFGHEDEFPKKYNQDDED